jgi:hypothetical protein
MDNRPKYLDKMLRLQPTESHPKFLKILVDLNALRDSFEKGVIFLETVIIRYVNFFHIAIIMQSFKDCRKVFDIAVN